jgi:branched-chain amino acid transport system permease protein
MSRYLKSAFFSALLVWAVAFPVLGLKLSIVGINLEVHGTGPVTLTIIALCSVLMFLRVLFTQQVGALLKSNRGPLVSPKVSQFLTLPRTQRYIIIGLIVAALIWPFFGSRGAVDIATLILIYVLLGLGLNIVVGLAGLLDLGYVGFYAVGAYTYALLSHYLGWSFWICLPLAGMAAATFGFLLGFPVLRLRGDYLAIVTLGFGEIIRLFLRNLTDITGGPNGISSIPKPTFFGLSFDRSAAEGMQTFHEYFGIAYNPVSKVVFLYLVALLLALAALFVINRLLRMPIGRAWEALREDEIACRALGLNPTVIKLSAFTLGAAFAGFAGSFFAARQGLVTPESFTFIESAIILAIVVLGGMGSQLGVILAAIVMILLPELMREFSEYRMLMFGAMMVLRRLAGGQWRRPDRQRETSGRVDRPQRRRQDHGVQLPDRFLQTGRWQHPAGRPADPGPGRSRDRPQGRGADLPERAVVQGHDRRGKPADRPAPAPEHQFLRGPVQDPGVPQERARGHGVRRVLAGQGQPDRVCQPPGRHPGLRSATAPGNRPLHDDPPADPDARRTGCRPQPQGNRRPQGVDRCAA